MCSVPWSGNASIGSRRLFCGSDTHITSFCFRFWSTAGGAVAGGLLSHGRSQPRCH
jgi:hypothetical protein